MSNNKSKRINLGSIYKSKDETKSDYIKVNVKEPLTLKPGDYIQVETKSYQLKSLDAAIARGVISEENAQKARERIENMPDFVRAELIYVQK